MGPGLSKLELIVTLKHGLGPWRVAEASSWKLTVRFKVTAPPETKTFVISGNTNNNVSNEVAEGWGGVLSVGS